MVLTYHYNLEFAFLSTSNGNLLAWFFN